MAKLVNTEQLDPVPESAGVEASEPLETEEQAEEIEEQAEEPRLLPMTLLTERPVLRWYGMLVVSCREAACDLSRYEAGVLPFLLDHDASAPIGRMVGLEFKGRGENRRLEGMAEMGTIPRSLEAGAEMDQLMRVGISPGIHILDLETLEEASEENDWSGTYQAARYDLIEVSSLTTPANLDARLKLGPSALTTLGIDRLDLTDVPSDDTAAKRSALIRMRRETAEGYLDVTPEEIAADAAAKLAADAAASVAGAPELPPDQRFDILQLGLRHDAVELAEAHVAAGGTLDDFREKLLAKTYRPVESMPADLHVTRNDGAAPIFNLGAVIKHKLHPDTYDLAEAAKPYLELSQDAERSADASIVREPGGVFVPGGWFPQSRGQHPAPIHVGEIRGEGDEKFVVTTATGSAGEGIQTTVDVSRAYQWLVDQAPILSYMTLMPGLIGDLSIPVATGAITIGAVAEGGAQALTDPTYGNISLSPKVLHAQVAMTRNALVQTAGWIDNFIRQQMGLQFGEEISKGVLVGSGSSNQVTGVFNQAGVGTLTSPGALTSLSLSKLNSMKTDVDAFKPLAGGNLFVFANDTGAQARVTLLDPGSGRFLFDEGDAGMGTVAQLGRGQRTTLMATKTAMYGDFRTAYVGFWDGFQVLVNPYADEPNVRVSGFQMYDIDIARSDLFEKATFT